MMSYARRSVLDHHGHGATSPVGALRALGVRLVLTLLRWQELAQQRRRLMALDDRMLKDIGITQSDARREGARPFWDGRGIEWTSWR